MKNKTLINILNRFLFSLSIISFTVFAGCSDDPESTNEEEVVTTFIVTLDPIVEEVNTVTLSWDDTNLDAVVDDTELSVSGDLVAGTAYAATIQILNKSADPEIIITEEIREEAEDHIFCFTVTGANISISNRDEDKHGLPLGITSTWTATSASAGTVNITLRHQPGVKTGDCPGAGDTDASITFAVTVGFSAG